MALTNKWVILPKVAIPVAPKAILLKAVIPMVPKAILLKVAMPALPKAIRSKLLPKRLQLPLAGPALVALSTKASSALNAVNRSLNPRLRQVGPAPAAIAATQANSAPNVVSPSLQQNGPAAAAQ